MATLHDVTSERFDELVLKSARPVLVDFWATWCGPCKALTPKLEEIAGELQSSVSIVKVNIEECPDITQRYSVRGVPAMLFFKSGEVQNSLLGNQSKDAIVGALRDLI